MLRVRNWVPKEIPLKHMQMLAVILAEEYVNRDVELNEKGVIVIFDLRGASLEQLRYLSVRELRRIIQVIQVFFTNSTY